MKLTATKIERIARELAEYIDEGMNRYEAIMKYLTSRNVIKVVGNEMEYAVLDEKEYARHIKELQQLADYLNGKK